MTNPDLPIGYRFCGIHCGVRQDADRPDLALIVSDRPARAAGVTTQNRVVAAPVILCRERLPRDDARGVVVCAGNANACTGDAGLRDARRMAELTATQIGCEPEQILVASTGIIGHPLPMPALESGIPMAATQLGDSISAFRAATHAILTTDTRPKVSWRAFELSGRVVRITGFAKGAAMIGPNLATMLGFLVTDANVHADDLRDGLKKAVMTTFNCISVEGHTSTNDTVLILANGEGNPLSGEDLRTFTNEVTAVCAELAREIAADAEGANHLVTIRVEGAREDLDARRIAKAVAESALVKTAIYGNDPNWGRIVSAAGYAGVPFAEREVSLWLGDMLLYKDGTPLPFDEETASGYLKHNREVTLRLRVGHGTGHCTFYTCDLTTEYVRLNADYTT